MSGKRKKHLRSVGSSEQHIELFAEDEMGEHESRDEYVMDFGDEGYTNEEGPRGEHVVAIRTTDKRTASTSTSSRRVI